MQIRVALEALGPVSLGTGLATQNVQLSHDYVPGGVWRGALAAAILDGKDQRKYCGRQEVSEPPDTQFRQVFLGDHVARFGNLFPVNEDVRTALGQDALPMPLTARTCKAFKGFLVEGNHGVLDLLMSRVRNVIDAGGREKMPLGCLYPECPERRLDRIRGFAVRTADDPSAYRETSAEHRAFVRVGLNRRTETAEQQILYVIDALVHRPDTPLVFVGACYLKDEQATALQSLLQQHLPAAGGPWPLRIGTARARGMGNVRLRLVPEASEATYRLPGMNQRIDNFQPCKDGRPLDDRHVYFALTLRGPLRLLDPVGRPATTLSAEILAAYVDRVPNQLEFLPQASAVEQMVCSGWSQAWGLPKPVVGALAPGTVLVWRVPADERSAAEAMLDSIEQNGLGEHRAEGWGEAVACDPFHITFDVTNLNS